jgi:hypothetical protein
MAIDEDRPNEFIGRFAGEARTRAVVEQGGLTRFRRAAETPFNVVYEVRP